MKGKIVILIAVLLVAFIAFLSQLLWKQTDGKQDIVEYNILSTRLLKRNNGYKITEGKPCNETSKSPAIFQVFVTHDCEMVLSGDNSVSYPECSTEKVSIESRLEPIKSNEEIPDSLKKKIAEHFDVELGKVFAGGCVTIGLGPKEFDGSKLKAQCVVGLAATVEDYEVVYTSHAIAESTPNEDNVEKKIIVSVYKSVAPFADITFLPTVGENIF